MDEQEVVVDVTMTKQVYHLILVANWSYKFKIALVNDILPITCTKVYNTIAKIPNNGIKNLI